MHVAVIQNHPEKDDMFVSKAMLKLMRSINTTKMGENFKDYFERVGIIIYSPPQSMPVLQFVRLCVGYQNIVTQENHAIEINQILQFAKASQWTGNCENGQVNVEKLILACLQLSVPEFDVPANLKDFTDIQRCLHVTIKWAKSEVCQVCHWGLSKLDCAKFSPMLLCSTYSLEVQDFDCSYAAHASCVPASYRKKNYFLCPRHFHQLPQLKVVQEQDLLLGTHLSTTDNQKNDTTFQNPGNDATANGGISEHNVPSKREDFDSEEIRESYTPGKNLPDGKNNATCQGGMDSHHDKTFQVLQDIKVNPNVEVTKNFRAQKTPQRHVTGRRSPAVDKDKDSARHLKLTPPMIILTNPENASKCIMISSSADSISGNKSLKIKARSGCSMAAKGIRKETRTQRKRKKACCYTNSSSEKTNNDENKIEQANCYQANFDLIRKENKNDNEIRQEIQSTTIGFHSLSGSKERGNEKEMELEREFQSNCLSETNESLSQNCPSRFVNFNNEHMGTDTLINEENFCQGNNTTTTTTKIQKTIRTARKGSSVHSKLTNEKRSRIRSGALGANKKIKKMATTTNCRSKVKDLVPKAKAENTSLFTLNKTDTTVDNSDNNNNNNRNSNDNSNSNYFNITNNNVVSYINSKNRHVHNNILGNNYNKNVNCNYNCTKNNFISYNNYDKYANYDSYNYNCINRNSGINKNGDNISNSDNFYNIKNNNNSNNIDNSHIFYNINNNGNDIKNVDNIDNNNNFYNINNNNYSKNTDDNIYNNHINNNNNSNSDSVNYDNHHINDKINKYVDAYKKASAKFEVLVGTFDRLSLENGRHQVHLNYWKKNAQLYIAACEEAGIKI